MADESEAIVDLDASAEEHPGDDSVLDVQHEEDGGEAQEDESLMHEEHGDSNGELDATGPEDENEAGDDAEEERSNAPDAESTMEQSMEQSVEQSMEQQSFEDPIAAQVRDAIFMVFDSIEPDQPLDVFVKLAADVICKMVCSGTPATSVGVALEEDNGSLNFISLAEKASEESVEIASVVDRVLPPARGVLHACLSQNAIVAIPDVLEEPSVHFFTGQRRAGSLVAMPFADESNTTRGVLCMDSCAAAAAAGEPSATAVASDLLQLAASLQEEADMMQAEADAVAADPDASEDDKQAAAAAAEEARAQAASAHSAAEAAAPVPSADPEGDAVLPAAAPATFSEDNISILEVMAHELSRAISMLHQRHSKAEPAAAAPLDSTFGSDAIADSPEPAEDAFQSPEDDYEEEMDPEALAAYEEHEAQKEELQARLKEAIAQREQLLSHNNELTKRVALYYHLKKNDEASSLPAEDAERSVSDKEQRYFQMLQKLVVTSQETQRVSEHYDRIEREMQARLEEKQIAAASAEKDLQALRDEAGKGSEAGHSGRPVPAKLLKQLADKERELDELLDEKRLSNLRLRHECKKLEQSIKKREEVSSELHMIDFEQLKIENQSLNEKIEERNEELLKLRKKTTSTVQVLTHLKEKLQFVQAENQVLKAELTGLEAELGQHRDAVTKVKLQRDNLRQENAKLKAKSGLVGNVLLLRDFDRRKREIESMEVRMVSLKEAQVQLTKEVKRHAEPLARLTGSMHKR